MLSGARPFKFLAAIAAGLCFAAVTACASNPPPTSEGTEPELSATDESTDTSEEDGTEVSDFVIELDGTPTTVAGANTKGDISLEKSPVGLGVLNVTCGKQTAADVGSDDDFEPRSLKAPSGDQLCLVSVSVKNQGKSPSFWTSSNTEMTLEDGSTWTMLDGEWSGQEIAGRRGKEYAGDSDLINPGKTEFDYLLFSIPADQEPAGLVVPNNGF